MRPPSHTHGRRGWVCLCSPRTTTLAEPGQHQPKHNNLIQAGREEWRVEATVNRALDSYYSAHHWWRTALVPRAMAQDWSWSRSAQSYLDLYRSMF